MNWIYQQALKIGNKLFEAYCLVVQPKRRGAYIAVWWNHRILLVENSYKKVLTLPSGGINSNETPLEGAIRELREEVGIVVDAGRFKALPDFVIYHDHFHDHVFPFELRFESEPVVSIDHREVTGARFELPNEALKLSLSEVCTRILASYSKQDGHISKT